MFTYLIKKKLSRSLKASLVSQKAFTMLEVILTITIFSVALAVVASSFSVGSRAWRTGSGQSNQQFKIYFALEKISQLIKNGIYFTDSANLSYKDYYDKLKFEGANNTLTFASCADLTGEIKGGFDKVQINKEDSEIVLTQTRFSDIGSDNSPLKRLLVAGVENLSFKYASLDSDNPDSQELIWKESWEEATDSNKSPLAIRVMIEYKEKNDQENLVTINRDVFLLAQQ